MDREQIVKEFEKSVKNKFDVYNSLFLNLPFRKIQNIGILVPILHHFSKNGLDEGKEPLEILDAFFESQADIITEEDKIDFMFRVIQYVERQVVLYDSVEDSAYSHMQGLGNQLTFKEFIRVIQNKESNETISEKLSDFSARIVFTAHPTQFYPPSVLHIISKLRRLITENDINGIDLTLQQLGLTSFTNKNKPTPFDEAKNIIYFLRHVFYDAVGVLYSDVKKSIKNRDFDNPDIIKLGFWPGGDRDGNPFVTSDITLKVADELRMNLMKCYYKDVKELSRKLTFREVEEIILDLRYAIYATMFDPSKTLEFNEIVNPLYIIRETLINKYNGLYLEELDNLIDKVKIFKTHFATLDIRQDHSVHKSAIEQILIKQNLIKESIDELSKEELKDILLNKDIKISHSQFSDELVKDTINTISHLKQIQNKNGEEGCNRYIISNSEDIFSVLFVYALFRWSGWNKENITFDIVPLFETMDGMSNSEAVMTELFSIPDYRKQVEKRNNKQTIMLGFSDGTKDGGYLKANWAIFETKEKLTTVCKQHEIKAIFFDGRGGPPARGGGKTHSFYAAQSREIANNEIQLTIQGQTISSKYGTQDHFVHNSEQLLTAGLENIFRGQDHIVSEESRKLIEELAQISFEKYTELKNHEKFIPYLENKSTLKYYGKANIGSRPAKRGAKKKLELKDLRAISFVGSWSQLKQNVPGYYGMGTAIKTLIDDGKLEDLKKLFNEVPFFKALILNSMMSLSKCYFELTNYIAKDEEYKDFWKILFDEFKLSKEMTLLISDYKYLMEEEPVSRKSIEIRERIVLPLLIIQQYALQKIEKESEEKETYEKIVKRSLYGNINASRNSA